MSKGQKRGNKELRKPKGEKKPISADATPANASALMAKSVPLGGPAKKKA